MITGVYYLTYFDGPLWSLRGFKAPGVPSGPCPHTFNLLLDQDFNPIPLSTREAETATYVPFDLDHVPEEGPSGDVSVETGFFGKNGHCAVVLKWPCFAHFVFRSYGEARKWISIRKS